MTSRDNGPMLWVGLGNPGSEHARQRHNIGFMALDEIARRHGFGPWRKRFKGEVAEGTIAGQRILALKPQTYMNASGDAVQQAAAFLKIPPENVIAFHDELDLAPGKLRVKLGGGVAGHNGLRDMRRAFGSPEFWRVRMGIGHPGHKDAVTGHVLGNFAKVDQAWLEKLLDAVNMDLMGPSAEDKANGAALLSAALVREAGALAQAAAGLRATLDLADGDTPRDEARRASAMAAALLLIARALRSHSQDAALAAQASLAGLAPMAIALPEISAALRAAALMPISDDGAARIAAGVVAETFWNALRAAWPAAPGA